MNKYTFFKRMAVIFVTIALVITLCACTAGGSTTEAAATMANSTEGILDRPQPIDDPSENENDYAPEEILIPHQISYDSYSKLYEGFSEGYCWAYFDGERSGDHSMIGLMDHNGRLSFFRSVKSVFEDLFGVDYWNSSDLFTTPFAGGFTVIYLGSSVSKARIEEGFLVLDGDGTVLFNSNDGDETTEYYYLGRTHDEILVRKTVASFAEKTTMIYLMDPYGNPTMEPITSFDVAEHMTELADGIFTRMDQIDDNSLGILNLNADTPFYYYSIQLFTDISGGYFVAGGLHGYCILPEEALESAAAIEEYRENASVWLNGHPKGFGEGLYQYQFGSEITFRDMNGQDVFTVTVPEQVSIRDCSAFQGGYAALIMTGADGNIYATLIDTAGNMQYDPVRIEKAIFMNNTFMDGSGRSACNGYLPVWLEDSEDISVITPDGRVLTALQDDWSELADLFIPDCDPHGVSGSDRAMISDGFMNTVYTSLYDEVGYGYIDLKTGDVLYYGYEVSTDGAAAPQVSADGTTEGKTYINPASFHIEGTWKSVGDYGFGQAQPGAVVSFDGTHCNLYSPMDTYAFYKEADQYFLDCTSVLSGTECFTVKIVDDDHIDLYNGGLVTELAKIN